MQTETFCSTKAIPADFEAMQKFHLAASKDTGRPVWLRRWHRQQADYCRRHDLNVVVGADVLQGSTAPAAAILSRCLT